MSESNSISTIELSGFQVHEKFHLLLGRGVTTIIGPSDVGKSAVLRAVRWLAQNDPSGEAFIRWGGKKAKVTLTLSDGIEITRLKGAGVNTYLKGEREFVAFGNLVPPEVEDVLKICPENFQAQYDRPFWIGETAGEVSRQLNQVVNLNVIDQVLSELGSRHRDVTTEVGIIEKRLEGLVEKKDRWAFASEMNQDLQSIEGLKVKGGNLREGIAQVLEVIQKGEEAQRRIAGLGTIVQEGEQVLKVAREWQVCQADAWVLDGLVTQGEEQVDILSRPLPDLEGLVDLRGVVEMWMGRCEALEGAIEGAAGFAMTATGLAEQLQRLEVKLKKEMGDVCLLCNQPIRS